ncbi:uncharacterized protein RCC_09824 [Ramularia collo-cygni]|uniref:Uncharacterized protein n=1 Tax=Ramularia collo-cygni TaxID=112498 RepID=A0A2D3V1A5_9PEZI|nr:uncharacterized protein RCC_09824 [Ramularia collo-cygni]CZT24107.1 uncharacterized protein RCC_09824 [Ramularia collo-cygni]
MGELPKLGSLLQSFPAFGGTVHPSSDHNARSTPAMDECLALDEAVICCCPVPSWLGPPFHCTGRWSRSRLPHGGDDVDTGNSWLIPSMTHSSVITRCTGLV